jgi:hypothetical protein
MTYDYKKHQRYNRINTVIGHVAYLLLVGVVFGAFIYAANRLDEIVNVDCEGSLVKCFREK